MNRILRVKTLAIYIAVFLLFIIYLRQEIDVLKQFIIVDAHLIIANLPAFEIFVLTNITAAISVYDFIERIRNKKKQKRIQGQALVKHNQARMTSHRSHQSWQNRRKKRRR